MQSLYQRVATHSRAALEYTTNIRFLYGMVDAMNDEGEPLPGFEEYLANSGRLGAISSSLARIKEEAPFVTSRERMAVLLDQVLTLEGELGRIRERGVEYFRIAQGREPSAERFPPYEQIFARVQKEWAKNPAPQWKMKNAQEEEKQGRWLGMWLLEHREALGWPEEAWLDPAETNTCNICFDDEKRLFYFPSCGSIPHYMCHDCIQRYDLPTCPICRQKIADVVLKPKANKRPTDEEAQSARRARMGYRMVLATLAGLSAEEKMKAQFDGTSACPSCHAYPRVLYGMPATGGRMCLKCLAEQ